MKPMHDFETVFAGYTYMVGGKLLTCPETQVVWKWRKRLGGVVIAKTEEYKNLHLNLRTGDEAAGGKTNEQ